MIEFLTLVALIALTPAATLSGDLSCSFFWSPTVRPNGRIVGGHATAIEQVPYQVSLRVYGMHICGGSIISKYWIVTAAHCIIYAPLQEYRVKAGSSNRDWGGSLHNVVAIIPHENYATMNYGATYNDIAVVRVNLPFTFDKTRRPIVLFNSGQETPVGAYAIVTGWGSTEITTKPLILQMVKVPIISKKECNEAYSIWGGLGNGQICALYPGGGKDACQGDSGGPLTINGRLAGITSWGRGCAQPGYPGAYTEIAAFREWIKLKSGV